MKAVGMKSPLRFLENSAEYRRLKMQNEELQRRITAREKDKLDD